MRKLFTPILLITICVICYGCPFGSPYALEAEPKEKVKAELLGTWVKPGENDSLTYRIEITKKSDYEYRIKIQGNLKHLIPTWSANEDSITLTGFTSTVNKIRFFNLLSQAQYYLVEIKMEDGVLSLMPLSDKFNYSLIKNNQRLKEIVGDHMKTGFPMYDELTWARWMVRQ